MALADEYHREYIIYPIYPSVDLGYLDRGYYWEIDYISAFYSPENNVRNKRQLKKVREEEGTASFWNAQAQYRLQQQLSKDLNFNMAKNVIMFLGDGMSIPTLSAARSYMGQLKGSTGEEERLSFEDFPHTGLSKVSLYRYYGAKLQEPTPTRWLYCNSEDSGRRLTKSILQNGVW